MKDLLDALVFFWACGLIIFLMVVVYHAAN